MTATRGPLDPRLLRHARTARTGVAALALLGAGQAVTTVAVAWALTVLVVSFAAGATAEWPVLVALTGAFAARAALTWAEQVVAQRTAARVTDELRRAVLTGALRRGPAWVAGYGSGRLTAVLGSGLDALRPWFTGYLPSLALGVALPPLVVAAMLLVDPASAVVTLLTLPLVPIFGILIGRATQRRAEQRWAADARLAGHFLDVVQGLATLRLFGRAQRQTAVVARMTDRHRVATMRVLRVAFLSSTALDLVGTLSVGLVAVEAGLRVAAGHLGLGPALLVILLAPEAYRPLREVAARYHAGAAAGAVIADVDEVLTDAVSIPGRTADSGEPGVVAADVRVRHPGRRVDALKLPALRVRRGELVALAGASGAGKTTALRVLDGRQPVCHGTVEVTGPAPLYLPQRPTLPHARTIADALLLDGEARPTDADLYAAVRAVGLDVEIARTAGGLDAPLGEHGRGLSSGQRQRLALARLLRQARMRRAVLLLDEPTAHLDPAAERLVIRELRAAATRGCAVLVVAHRPALLAAADRVVDIRRPAAGPATTTTTASPAPAADCAAPTPGKGADQRPVHAGPAAAGSATGRFAAALLREPATAVGLGAAAWLAAVTLTAAAGWLLTRASTLPPVLSLSAAVVVVRAAAVSRPLVRYLERLASHEVAFARLGEWRAQVYAGLVPRVPGAIGGRRGELLTRVVDDVDARVDGLLRGRLPATSAAVALGVATLAASMSTADVGTALLAGLVVTAILAPGLAARHAARFDADTARARARLRDAVVETVDGLEELGSPAGPVLAVPDRRSRALSVLEARAARVGGAAAALAQVGWGVAVVGTATVLGTGTPEVAAVLLLGAVALAEPALTLPDAAVARRRAAAARDRLTTVTAGPAPTGSAGRSRPASATPHTGLVVRGLVAGWDPGRPPAVSGLDLDLPAGARIAVLGDSGSGKSTLAAVLVRLLEPRAGTVRLGGSDLRDVPATEVHHRVCLVGDEVDHVFASTVRENLRLALPAATDDALRAVLDRVRLRNWLAALPHGLDTWLGAGGTTVSGGERRRLAIARALLADPDLLVLDEPTEGLDEGTASALMADLLAVTAGRSVLLLTHRREGLDRVDEVYDLTGGSLRPASVHSPA